MTRTMRPGGTARPMRRRRGVYTTATARRLRRRARWAAAREYAADFLWGLGVFTSICVGVIVVMIGALLIASP